MNNRHYFQESTDEGLHLANLFIRLARSPGSIDKKEWDYLNKLPISTIEREAKISHRKALHIANQIDRIEADVSKMGKAEHLSDAFMMWLVGGSFCLAGVLLALISLPETALGKLMIPISLGVGLFFICMPFINRKKALNYDEQCFTNAVIQILGTGLLKRSALTTDALIREINRNEPKKVLFEVVNKFLDVQGNKYPKAEELILLEQLLDGFSLKLKDVPHLIIQEISG